MLQIAAVIFSLQPYGGISAGELDWNIAYGLDPAITPNVVSELKFTTEALHLGLKGKVETDLFFGHSQIYLEMNTNYGVVFGGESTDSDYFGDNRTGLYSRSESEVAGDSLNILEGGVGVKSTFFSLLTISLSYGGHHLEQNLNFKKGRQTYADPAVFFPVTLDDLTDNLQQNLDSDYVTEWSGQWLSLQAMVSLGDWEFYIQSKRSHGDYYGEGRWNLRSTGVNAFQQPKSFTHEAKSHGKEWSLGMFYSITNNLSLNLEFVEKKQEADAGLSVTYYSNGTFDLSVFNGASWKSSEMFVGVQYSF